MAKMDESKLSGLLDGYITDSESYDGSERAGRRKEALEYFNAVMTKFDTPAGKSSFISQDVADAIGWLLPGLMRVFLASDKIGEYEPQTQKDEPFAKQATDYVNYTLMRESDGYSSLRSAMHEALMLGNGILKHWWDSATEYGETQNFTGLSEDLVALLVNDPEIEISSAKEKDGYFDLTAKRIARSGRMKIEAVADEDFLIERSARALNEKECRFCAHKGRPTRSELIEQGYDREVVEELPEVTQTIDDDARDKFRSLRSEDQADQASQRVLVYECYVFCDYDGDGIAEWRKVLIGGNVGKRQILSNEEWGEDLPFTDLVPDPVPHVWKGRSIFDDVKSIQEVKTVITRKMLDNVYLAVEPMRAVDYNRILNPEELIDVKAGAVIQVKGNPADAISEYAIPFVAKEAFPMLEYMDTLAERRTGVGANSQGLDQDALQNQTATAVQATQAAQSTRKEDYARNIAEIGMKRFFKCLLKIIVRHQDKPRTIRLRDEWVEMDPRAWNADMDVSINTGLGSGNRDRDLQMLQGIAMKQEQLLMQQGPVGPACDISMLNHTYQLMVEAAGIKGPERFFKTIGPEDLQKIASAPKPPDPKVEIEKAKLQVAQGKAQSDAQIAMGTAQANAQLEREKAQADVQLDAQRGQAELGLKIKEIEAKSAASIEEINRKHQISIAEMQQKHQLEVAELQANIALKQMELAAEAQLERESMESSERVQKANIRQADPV